MAANPQANAQTGLDAAKVISRERDDIRLAAVVVLCKVALLHSGSIATKGRGRPDFDKAVLRELVRHGLLEPSSGETRQQIAVRSVRSVGTDPRAWTPPATFPRGTSATHA